jgi:hypothetical protein
VSLRIGVDIGALGDGAVLTREMFPNLAFAVRRVTQLAHEQWLDYANGGILPSGLVIQNRTGEYARSILVRELGDFSAEVYSDLPYARAIEEGTPQRDMKRMLDSSLKVRLTKDGRRYLIIPIRWNSPRSVLGNNMPVDVANWWKGDRQSSHITGTGLRPSGTGAYDIHTRQLIHVPSRTYSWGSRIKKADLHQMGFRASNPAAKRLEGMVRFRRPGKTGGAAHTQFLTFRVMMEGSKGWIAPAQPGKWPARSTSEVVQPIAEQLFAKAVEHDIQAHLNAAP